MKTAPRFTFRFGCYVSAEVRGETVGSEASFPGQAGRNSFHHYFVTLQPHCRATEDRRIRQWKDAVFSCARSFWPW